MTAQTHNNLPHRALLMQQCFVCFVLFSVILSATELPPNQSDIPCEPRIINDTTAIRNAGYQHAFQGSGKEEFRACLRSGILPTLCVFRNGMQIGELDTIETKRFLLKNPSFLSGAPPETTAVAVRPAGNRAAELWGRESFCATLFNKEIDRKHKVQRIVALGSWQPGFTIGDRMEAAGSSVLVMRNTLRCSGMVKFFHFYAGAGFHSTWFNGETADILMKNTGSKFRNYSFSVTVGMPFVRYEMKTAAWILPEYFWLEEDMVSIMNNTAEGTTLAQAQWKWGASHLDNLAHALFFRIGHLYLDLVFDQEIYKGPIARISLDHLPSIAGTWGVSLTKAMDVMIPGVWLNLPQITTNRIAIRTRHFPLTIDPLRIHFNYWDLHRYNYGLTIQARIGYQRHTGSEHE